MQKTRIQDLVIGLITVALGVFFWTYTPGFSKVSRTFSQFVLALFIGLGVILCVISIINRNKPSGKEVTVKEFKNPLLIYIIIVIYVVLMEKLGFFASTILFMPAVMLFMGYRRPIPMICVTAGMTGFIYFLFVMQLKVRLPQGILF